MCLRHFAKSVIRIWVDEKKKNTGGIKTETVFYHPMLNCVTDAGFP